MLRSSLKASTFKIVWILFLDSEQSDEERINFTNIQVFAKQNFFNNQHQLMLDETKFRPVSESGREGRFSIFLVVPFIIMKNENIYAITAFVKILK